MKFVNDKGLSTPERLYAIGDMLKANFRWHVFGSGIPKSNYRYSISILYVGDGDDYSHAEPEQVSIGQTVLWLAGDDIYLGMINTVYLQTEEITLDSVSRWQGEQGQSGEKGKDALLYTTIYSSSTEVKPANTYVLPRDQFNRTPDVLEYINGLIVTWDDKSSGSSIKRSYECIARIMAVNATSVTISITNVVETTGEAGPAGIIDQGQINSIKREILQTIYPVGAYYITEKNENPSATLGFGTWTQVQGEFLLGASSTYSVGSEGGEKEHTLTVNEMPAHGHKLYEWVVVASYGLNTGKFYMNEGTNTQLNIFRDDTDQNRYSVNAGGNAAHNNMPPYRAVFIWRRTA